jgi:flavin reductase (DIM6/NTAB) family NADH-FMN oxidoreductase RutF
MSLTPTGMILFKKDLKEYLSLDQTAFHFSDFRVYTIVDGTTYELSGKESIICLDPLQLCMIDTAMLPETITVFYAYKNEVTAVVTCKKRNIAHTSYPIQVYEVEKSELKYHSILRLLIYYYKINSGKQKYPFRKYLNLAAAFFYPRKVVLVSVACEDFTSIFPMDFRVQSAAENIVVLGLRKTNQTNEFTGNKNLKLSVANFDKKYKDEVYSFGKFHSTEFPDLKDLPYRFIRTQQHGNIFPDFISHYMELEFVNSIDLGEQNMLICKIVHAHIINSKFIDPLYHVHYLGIHD